MTDVLPADADLQAPACSAPWWRSSRRIIGIVLVALWIGLAGWSLWAAPRESSADHLRAQVAAGEVTGWRFTDQQPTWDAGANGPLGGWPGTDDHSVDADNAGILVWSDSQYREHWIRISQLGSMPAEPGSQGFGDATQAWLGREFVAHHGSSVIRGDVSLPTPVNLARLAFLLVGLAGICGGVAPRIANRWYWFWMCGITFGLGLLAYAVFECLRDPKPRAARFGGGTGFVTMIAGSLAISLAFSLVGAFV
ncbi:hypothetical protein [Branchiibius hedensis]|nr:hypothetical protein [Branchiibius hedensis]